jgi:hypothetical protein
VFGVLTITYALVAFEVLPVAARAVEVPDVSLERPWVAFLREHTPDDRSVVCLPFADAYSAKGCEHTARWMLHGTRHGMPLVNGYSGFFPESWFGMAEALKDDPLGEESLDMMAHAGVEYVVIQPRWMTTSGSPVTASGRYQLEPVLRDRSGVEIWRLVQQVPGS